jgi:hypothetical protein
VKSVKPRDQVEAMLAAQMAMIHLSIMTTSKRLLAADSLEQQDSSERAVNRLSRTFAAQMDALKRYRDIEAKPVDHRVPAAAETNSTAATRANATTPLPAVDPNTPTANEVAAENPPSERVVSIKRAAG